MTYLALFDSQNSQHIKKILSDPYLKDWEHGFTLPAGIGIRRNPWATQKSIAELFSVSVPTINEHLKNIFESGELEQNPTIRKFRIVRQEAADRLRGNFPEHYNFDAIISVGWRLFRLCRASAGRQTFIGYAGFCQKHWWFLKF